MPSLLCSIKLSEIKIPKSYISILNGTGISVQGTEIAIKLDELWSYDFAAWYVSTVHIPYLLHMRETITFSLSKLGKECVRFR